MKASIQAGGNAEVIKMLEMCAAAAREHPSIAHVTVAYVYSEPGEDGRPRAGGGWAGDVMLEQRAERLVRSMADETHERIINRTMPARDPDVPADYVVYNVPAGSISYDFVIWLIDAEMTRIREGAPAPLKVHFWFGRDGKTGLYYDAQRQMFEKVCKPALGLVGAIEHHDAIHGRDYARRHFREIMTAAQGGQKPPIMKAPARAREAVAKWLGDGPAPITITLREADHWPHRNSNNRAWFEFALDLKGRGERVIFVRDTALADHEMPRFETCPQASTDLHMRMALYERAKANLFVANGPCILAAFSDRPWLNFTPIEPDDSLYKANTPLFWRMHVGIDVGEQYPWARADQRIVWKRDDYENIVEAWKELSRCVGEKTRAA